MSVKYSNDILDNKAYKNMEKKFEIAMNSIITFDFNNNMAKSWTRLLSDLLALSVCIFMLIDELDSNLNTVSVVPYCPQIDIKLFEDLPTILSCHRNSEITEKITKSKASIPDNKCKQLLNTVRLQSNALIKCIRSIDETREKYGTNHDNSTNISKKFNKSSYIQSIRKITTIIRSGTEIEEY